MVKIKEIKESVDVDLTDFEHKVIYIASLIKGVDLAIQGLYYKDNLNRMDLHAIAGLIEALKKEVDKLDEKFYSEVVERVENIISDKLQKGA